ncbi:hypothetical protein O181_066237, partial [Austropuccinia psidii MF-1]|nr:hypothetical protein [Austropuccinia psidii MF-1]
MCTVIITQNNQQEPISSELINLDISNTLQKAKNLANNQEQAISPQEAPKKGHRRDYGRSQSDTEGQGSVKYFHTNELSNSEADDTIVPSKRAETTTRSLSGHLKSQPVGVHQCTAAQRVPDPFRSVGKLHELIPYCKKIPGSSQHLQGTQWMASIDGKEEYDAFNGRMEEKQPSTTKASAKKSPSGQQQKFQHEKAAKSSKQGQREGTSPKALQPGLQDSKDSAGCHGKCISDGQNHDGITAERGINFKIPEMISDIFDPIPELYEAINDVKNHLSDKNETICNNIRTNNLSLCQVNETLIIKQAPNIIKIDNKKVFDDISNSFTELKTYTIALKRYFDASQEEVSKLSMKLNSVTADNTRQTELWQELIHKEDMYEIEVIKLRQAFQHEYRNSQRCSNSKMNDIEKILKPLPRMSTSLNQNEGTRTPNPQVVDPYNPQLKNAFSTSFHNLEPSMVQALLKEVQKLKEWPHFSGDGEYDHMEFIRGIDIIKEDFELPDRLVTARFNTLFTRSAHRWYINVRLTHGDQSWTWWKTQIINKWANDTWRFKVEKAFESAKFNADKDKALPWVCQQKYRLTALYPDMSEFMIHRKILRQCGGDLEHAVKSRTTEQSSAGDIINILEEVTTRTKIGSSRVNLKTRFTTTWKDSVDKNLTENCNNKYKSADT